MSTVDRVEFAAFTFIVFALSFLTTLLMLDRLG
jgi:hypothetical protein